MRLVYSPTRMPDDYFMDSRYVNGYVDAEPQADAWQHARFGGDTDFHPESGYLRGTNFPTLQVWEAEAMFDWPIYQAGMAMVVLTGALTAGMIAREED